MIKNLCPWLGFVCLVLTLGWASDAGACFAGPDPHELDPEEQALDHEPPGVPDIQSADVLRRGKADDCSGHGTWSSSSVDNLGIISIKLQAPADDRTLADEMGYRIEYLDGDMPEGLLPDYDVRVRDGQIGLGWGDGQTDHQEALDFRLTIRAVDLGGNVSEPTGPIEILHPGSSGCASTTPSPIWLLAFALFCLRRSRR